MKIKLNKSMKIFSHAKQNTDQWLKDRDYGLGGSDAAAACGLSKYKSRLQLWLEKKGIYKADTNNNFTEWGIKLESIIAEKFFDNYETFYQYTAPEIFQSTENEFMLASFDRLILDGNDNIISGLEIKNIGEYKNEDIKNDVIFDDHILQCQHYMYVAGVDYWYLACLVGGNKYYEKLIERDNELIEMMIEKEKEFMDMLKNDIMPEPSYLDDNIVEFLFDKKENQGKKEITNEFLIDQFKYIDGQIKELEKIKDQLKNKIILELDHYEIGFTEKFNIFYKEQNRFNPDIVLEKYPELYNRYQTLEFDNDRFKKEQYKLYKDCTEKGSRKFLITNRSENKWQN